MMMVITVIAMIDSSRMNPPSPLTRRSTQDRNRRNGAGSRVGADRGMGGSGQCFAARMVLSWAICPLLMEAENSVTWVTIVVAE